MVTPWYLTFADDDDPPVDVERCMLLFGVLVKEVRCRKYVFTDGTLVMLRWGSEQVIVCSVPDESRW